VIDICRDEVEKLEPQPNPYGEQNLKDWFDDATSMIKRAK
jgi:hypothetical protein